LIILFTLWAATHVWQILLKELHFWKKIKIKNELQESQSKYFRISTIVAKYAASNNKYLTGLSKNKIPTHHQFQLAIRVCWMDEY